MSELNLITWIKENKMIYSKSNFGITLLPINPLIAHFYIKIYQTDNWPESFQYNLYIYPTNSYDLRNQLQLKYGNFILGRFVKTFYNLNNLINEIHELNTINIKKVKKVKKK